MVAGGVELRRVAAATRVLRLGRGMTVARALARLRLEPGVRWALPDYIAPNVILDDRARKLVEDSFRLIHCTLSGTRIRQMR
jgi:hypothetical protein